MKEALALAGWTLLVVALALPLWLMVAGSLSTELALSEGPVFLPSPVLAHYRSLFEARDFWTPIRNSLVVAGSTTVLCLVLGSGCAWALARLRFPGRDAVLGFVLAISMFPQIAIVSPLYLLLRSVGLLDTLPGLVLPYLTFAMPLTVWMLTTYLRALPPDLEEAAWMDGASRLRTLREIVLPLAMPGLVTTGLITFLYCWNEFLFALSFTVGQEQQTVPVAIALFRGQYRVPWGEILAGAVVATAPVALIVLLFQRRIVRGLTAGGVKG